MNTTEQIAGLSPDLSPDVVEQFARLALSHVEREYPNKLDHVMTGMADVRSPRQLHPVFYGSFDWHSCVHGYWMLATLLRLQPGIAAAPAIRALFDRALTQRNIAAECDYAAQPSSRGFERPYGWAWCLMLAAELKRHGGAGWFAALRPLAQIFVDRWQAFLPLAEYPVRVGTHPNTAFALRLSLEYARECGDDVLAELFVGSARSWYGADRDCQAWEPSLDEFLSPALIEAELMRQVLEPAAFCDWFDAFLPGATQGAPTTLFTPVEPRDRSDGKLAHLDGLNLSRAWCWRGIAATLGAAHAASEPALRTAAHHLQIALPRVSGDYMGEHWLASFAVLALLDSLS